MSRSWIQGLLLLVIPFLVTASASAQNECEGPDAARWVDNIYRRATSHDVLGLAAIEWYGDPVSCSGRVVDVFDGVEFGELQLDFRGGAFFRLETFPPESSVATLTDSSGFKDETFVCSVLKRYTGEIGVDIDWSAPEVEKGEHRRIVTFWDPDDGLNASARLVYSDDVLVSVGFSMAL